MGVSHFVCCNLQSCVQTSVSCSASPPLGLSLLTPSTSTYDGQEQLSFASPSAPFSSFLLPHRAHCSSASFLLLQSTSPSVSSSRTRWGIVSHIREPWIRQGGQKILSFLYVTPSLPLYLYIFIWTSLAVPLNSPILSSVGQCFTQK